MNERGDYSPEDKNAGRISAMFNNIAGSYDNVNHLLSLNIDVVWRKKMVEFLLLRKGEKKDFKVLDIACGTGDSTIAIYKKGMKVTGADIASGMLDIAKRKNSTLQSYPRCAPNPKPEYILASAEQLPFEAGSFDAVTISFGIRNFNKRPRCLGEIYKVIKPGGSIAILEFAAPRNRLLGVLYRFYLTKVLPFVGGAVSKDRHAYRYLASSIEQFPKYEAFCTELTDAGFNNVSYKPLTGGIAVLYTGTKN